MIKKRDLEVTNLIKKDFGSYSSSSVSVEPELGLESELSPPPFSLPFELLF
jgi:hypothetical protein